MVYLVLFILVMMLMIISILSYSKGENYLKGIEKIWLPIIFICLFFVSGFRDMNVGVDTKHYINFFEKVIFYDGNISEIYYEKGYILLNKVLACITNNKQMILIITSLIILVSVFYTCYKYSRYSWLSIYLFITLMFYYNSMNVLRQYISISIILLGYKYILDRKIFKYLTTVAIATMFHSSAIICIIMYIIPNIPYKIKYMVIISIISIITYLFLPNILNIVFNIFNNYSGYYSYIGNINLASILNFLFYLIIFIICIKIMLYKITNNKANDLINQEKINSYFIFIGLILLGISIKMSILNRISDYFLIFSIIHIPNCISMIKNKKKILIVFFIMLITALYNMLIFKFRPDWHQVIPYNWIF